MPYCPHLLTISIESGETELSGVVFFPLYTLKQSSLIQKHCLKKYDMIQNNLEVK